MIMLSILAVIYALTLAFDFRPRFRESAPGEKALYLALLTISLVPLVLNALDVPVPSPAKPIADAVKAVFHVP